MPLHAPDVTHRALVAMGPELTTPGILDDFVYGVWRKGAGILDDFRPSPHAKHKGLKSRSRAYLMILTQGATT